ncbi:hypothetical protein BC936DRAFT_139307 [Jimgerdemannia flammicorona]|uniref:Uncharacterized protein n=2 Tax=Jimgerdemannia flammicorona TaxID=994334 RepID=A0A433Q1P2_9FUNG|nr:hypothetical protein BC936DRAFT_139307 [Jimgerdemannia flammicorona]RUS23735.1 hypothetical protein BC938DRAFT_474705 [Jimgerdemannia flammicorona]
MIPLVKILWGFCRRFSSSSLEKRKISTRMLQLNGGQDVASERGTSARPRHPSRADLVVERFEVEILVALGKPEFQGDNVL